MHGFRGASGDVLARGPDFPQISSPARPPRPRFPPSRNTPRPRWRRDAWPPLGREGARGHRLREGGVLVRFLALQCGELAFHKGLLEMMGLNVGTGLGFEF